MLFWYLLGIAGTKLASLELLLAPPCCCCCPVEALCTTSLFARCLHPKQAEYGIFNHAQECIWYSFHLWKNKLLKGTAGREDSCLQREALPRWRGGISASLFGGRCLTEWGVIISSWLFIPVGCYPPSQGPANKQGLPNWDRVCGKKLTLDWCLGNVKYFPHLLCERCSTSQWILKCFRPIIALFSFSTIFQRVNSTSAWISYWLPSGWA